MKNKYFNKTLMILAVVLTLAVPSLAQWGLGRGQTINNRGMCLAQINAIPKQALGPTETAGLAYMREEEKLARDVYAILYSKWGMRIFGNISQAEERHLSIIKLLLDGYKLPDPAANQPVGIFQNEGLQTLYGDLVRQGESTLQSAMRVGATIEDLNIRDLEKAAAATDNSDLKFVYQNLLRASENHLRAFVRQLTAAGETYTPQYITPEAFAEIVSQQAVMGFGTRGNGQRGLGRGNNGICPWINP